MKTGLLAALALALAPAARAQTVDLASMEAGKPPAGFELARTGKGAPGTWIVVEDASAPGGRALAQTSVDRTDYRVPLAILPLAPAANVEVHVSFKPLEGRVDRAGGLAVRLNDADNYYVVRANALEDNVRFYRVIKGKREQLAGADVKVVSGAWYELGLKAEDDRFIVSFDGKTLFTASDHSLTAPGRVALWTKADSVTRFAAIDVRTMP